MKSCRRRSRLHHTRFFALLSLVFFSFSCTLLTTIAEEITNELNETVQEIISSENVETETLLNDSFPHTEDPPEINAVNSQPEEKRDPANSQEFVFADALSQNSGISNGIVDSVPPVLITLDTAAAELADAVRNVDSVESGRLSPNYSEASSELGHVAIKLPADVAKNDSEDVPQTVVEKEATPTEPFEGQDLNISSRVESPEILSEEIPKENDTEIELVKPKETPEAPEEIPSFSEWAQKQLEEAEKNKEVVVNDSIHSANNVQTSGVNFKVRSKNYASPDCGAKIIAANPESGSSSFILSPSRDEYMLNTCNSRIWFIVELCEAIQAKKIDLANFELFSSTPKNFSVWVSDRFPSREWAGVGQFIAKDERDIQTFNLYPHLFGKFIKVELHSHYGSEHYCPISLFRVYGTSEFEVFETENSPHAQTHQITDDDEDDVLELSDPEKSSDSSRNLFGSARDAVMSIMKKAAEVLVKGSNSNRSATHLEINASESNTCQTPSHIIVCDNCSNALFSDVYELMSCHNSYLKTFVESPMVYNSLCNTDMCQHYGLDFKSKKTSSHKTEFASYISAFLVPSYVAALCNMLAIIEKKVVLNTSYETDLNVTSNLTIDKKTQTISNEGLLDELLQGPFSCEKDMKYCEDKTKDDVDIVLSDTNPILSDTVTGTLSDIKPTKTLQKDNDLLEPSVITDSKNIISPPQIEQSQLSDSIESIDANKVKDEPSEIDVIQNTENVDNNDSILITTAKPDSFVDIENQNSTSNPEINNIESINISDTTVEDNSASQEQISLDNLINELEQVNNDPSTPAPPLNTMSSLPQGQKESVFLRLSNRIKALEKNMSLSGQYLEELSRRYKKQVEEMQKTFEKTLLTVSEESKRSEERDHKNTEELLVLQQQIAHLSNSVTVLLAERDSFLGSISLFKVIIFQVVITLLIFYIFRRGRHNHTAASDTINDPKSSPSEKSRRKSEEVISDKLLKTIKIKRRPSEEALNITCLASSNNGSKSKKKKRKSSTVQRSLSIANPTESEFLKTDGDSSLDDKNWLRSDLNKSVIEPPIALEEAEFIIPEIQHLDLSKLSDNQKSNPSDLTPKKEFPKTNGSIFGKKPVKERRLSSPGFLKSALGRQSSRSDDFCIDKSTPDKTHIPKTDREIRSEDRELLTSLDTPSLNEWSSTGELSQGSSSTTTNSGSKTKKSKKQSFKNMLKKVF